MEILLFVHLEVPPAKYRPYCLGLNGLRISDYVHCSGSRLWVQAWLCQLVYFRCPAIRQYLNQWRFPDKWAPTNKPQWLLNQDSNISFRKYILKCFLSNVGHCVPASMCQDDWGVFVVQGHHSGLHHGCVNWCTHVQAKCTEVLMFAVPWCMSRSRLSFWIMSFDQLNRTEYIY